MSLVGVSLSHPGPCCVESDVDELSFCYGSFVFSPYTLFVFNVCFRFQLDCLQYFGSND